MEIEKYVTLIGAANLDIQGFTREKLISRDSNPGKIRICPGGVSRNIADNLSKLKVKTRLISAIGEDISGNRILDECARVGINTEDCLVPGDMDSSIYMAIMDDEGDMALALSDMTILNQISVEYIKGKKDILDGSGIIEMDTCLSEEVIDYVLSNYRNVYVDPVSVTKAGKIEDNIGKVHTLKLNRLEAEYLSGTEIKDETDLEKTSSGFIEKGVNRVFITLGAEGVYYMEGESTGSFRPPEDPEKEIRIINATGAGDAFMAGIIYCSLKGYSIEETARFAAAASVIALSGMDTVSPLMSIENISNIIQEKFTC